MIFHILAMEMEAVLRPCLVFKQAVCYQNWTSCVQELYSRALFFASKKTMKKKQKQRFNFELVSQVCNDSHMVPKLNNLSMSPQHIGIPQLGRIIEDHPKFLMKDNW
jgi:hypothetical protein